MSDLITTLAFIYGLTALSLVLFFWDFIYGAMYMRLPKAQVQKMLELAEVGKGKVVYDLGAGFGNIGFAAAGKGATVIAVERNPLRYRWIKYQIKKKQLTNMTCDQTDIRKLNLSNADIILSYTSDGLMNAVAAKQLKANVTIVSASHKIKGWTPTLIERKNVYELYCYKK